MNQLMKHFLCAALLALVAVAGVSRAAPPVADDPAASDARAQAVRKRFAERFDATPVTGVRSTPYGLFEVQIGSDIVYTDEKVSFVLDGTLIDAKTRTDVTRERLEALSKVPFDQLPFELSFKQVRGDGSRKIAIFDIQYRTITVEQGPNKFRCAGLDQGVRGFFGNDLMQPIRCDMARHDGPYQAGHRFRKGALVRISDDGGSTRPDFG